MTKKAFQRSLRPSLILYELNEVPLKVINSYIHLRKNSNISKLAESYLVPTVTYDIGELHPWTTWPTVHRGVNNSKHKIQFLNQNLDHANKDYPPIWQYLLENGVDIGVFGSLQSYPPLSGDNVKFYIPDTFAPSFNTYPKSLRHFQRFNLKMARKNKAVAGSISIRDLSLFMHLFISGAVSYRAFILSIYQLIREFVHKPWKSLRPLLQPVIAFDYYTNLLRKTKPRFSTFFTNHVAGMMHRYWFHLYPEDYSDNAKQTIKSSAFHQSSIFRAMDIADYQLGKLMNYAAEANADLWVVSSMGQAAIEREKYIPELLLINYKKLLDKCSLCPDDYEFVPAMQPDICFKCSTQDSLCKLQAVLSEICDSNGKRIFEQRYEPVNNTINFWLKKNQDLVSKNYAVFNGHHIPLKELGLQIISRDPGTGYHIPEGIFMAIGPNCNILPRQNKPVDTTCIYSLIQQLFR